MKKSNPVGNTTYLTIYYTSVIKMKSRRLGNILSQTAKTFWNHYYKNLF